MIVQPMRECEIASMALVSVRRVRVLLEAFVYVENDDLPCVSGSARSVDLQGGRCWRGFGYKEVTGRCLEALELKGGDGGACKVLGWLLGDVMVMQERNTTLFQLLDFSIHNLHWFFYKVEFVIELKLFHWNDKGFVG
ncbi:hypothetical protein Tco_1009246 [Tanacetum coccineum]